MRQTARRPLPPFRVYLCETSDKIARVSGIDARTDADAHKIAVQMLKNRPIPTLRFGSWLGSFVRCVGANKPSERDHACAGRNPSHARSLTSSSVGQNQFVAYLFGATRVLLGLFSEPGFQ